MFRFYVFLGLVMMPFLSFAQADLVITSTNFQPNSIKKGDTFLAQATVTNIGADTAGATSLFFYYSDDFVVSPEEFVSGVSIKELAPNESQNVDFIYPISSALMAGDYYVAYQLDPYDIVPESDENNLFCASDGTNCMTFSVEDAVLHTQKFMYPILFIHGLASNSKTWDAFLEFSTASYGWSFGGQFDYCLNPDGDQSTSDGFITPFVNYSNLTNGDYYLMNFDVSTDGTLYVSDDWIPFNEDESNQAAVVKQGWAVHDAIEKILYKTGAEKVILVGHSMGGMASREYLQNPYNWQSDGAHHVAKVLTIGTPNGGSNADVGALSQLVGIDPWSEAGRDLKHNGDPFVYNANYLFGGTESPSDFYNEDVNCNGIVGDDIVGLNQKYAQLDVDYSCIVSNHLGLGGDDVVKVERANLNNYLLAPPPLAAPYADLFEVTSGHIFIHTSNHSTLMQGLDEPAFYDLAYPLPLNTLHFGYSTIQAENLPIAPPNNQYDWDDYSLMVSDSGELVVDIWDIPVADFLVRLLDEELNVLEVVHALGRSNVHFSHQASAGKYYLEIGSLPNDISYRMPYAISTQFTSASGLDASFVADVQNGCAPFLVDFLNQSTGNPTTYSWVFDGGVPSSSNLKNPTVTYNDAGVYPVSLTITNSLGSTSIKKHSFVFVKAAPHADFAYEVMGNDTVSFTNYSQYASLEIPSYLWTFGDGETSSEISPVHIYDAEGVYDVQLKATNSCGNTLLTKSVDVTVVGQNDMIEPSHILLFPNPTNDLFTMRIEGAYQGEYELMIFNNMGQMQQTIHTRKSMEMMDVQIDISDFENGTYFVRVQSKHQQQVFKIIKVR